MKRIDIAGRQFYWEDCGAALSGIDGKEAEGRLNLRLHLVFPGKTGKEKGILKFSMPALRTDGVWTACGGLNRWLTPDWGPVVLPVRSVCEYPVVSVVSFDDRNVLTVSCADTRCTLRAGYREEKSELVFEAVWEVSSFFIQEPVHIDPSSASVIGIAIGCMDQVLKSLVEICSHW